VIALRNKSKQDQEEVIALRDTNMFQNESSTNVTLLTHWPKLTTGFTDESDNITVALAKFFFVTYTTRAYPATFRSLRWSIMASISGERRRSEASADPLWHRSAVNGGDQKSWRNNAFQRSCLISDPGDVKSSDDSKLPRTSLCWEVVINRWSEIYWCCRSLARS